MVLMKDNFKTFQSKVVPLPPGNFPLVSKGSNHKVFKASSVQNQNHQLQKILL
jgi:hypothetical protein